MSLKKVMPVTRREALSVLGMGAIGMVSGCGPSSAPPPLTSTPEPSPRLIIRTVLGDIPAEQLADGATLFHEHMSLNNQFWLDLGLERLIDPEKPYFMEDMDFMVAEMQAALDDGIACIVDGGHTDMGRDVAFLRELSEKSGMPIVVSGGYYHEPTFPDALYNQAEDDLVRELVMGAETERWGAFGEIGFSAESTETEHKVLRAVGRAHLETKIPIFTHTANGKEAVAQLDLLESVGVDPQRVTIGHLGYPDITVHEQLCERGAFVGFDRLGGDPEADAGQVPIVLRLVDAGFENNVLLASDFAMYRETRAAGGPGYGKTVTRFVPLLREAGMSDEVIHRIISENPRRFLSFSV
tara:strand:- start:1654 stop:2715 length:1062 start_codon:yes stop_codon:yes gene_type:complete